MIVRPRGLTLIEHVVLADVEPMPGDRLVITLEGMLPLPGRGGWPHLAASHCHELVCAAEGEGI